MRRLLPLIYLVTDFIYFCIVEPFRRKRELCMVIALWALASPLAAQDFDRLTIRPFFDFGLNTYKSGIVKWCQSDSWPVLEPECVGLRAPESGTSTYTMTFGAELPSALACIMVDATGQWSYEHCGGGEIPLYVSGSVLLDNDTDNESCSLARASNAVTGVDLFYLYLDCAADEHVQWAFRVPQDFTTQPTLKVWTDRTGTGSDDFNVKLRCTAPDNSEDFTSQGWDDTYTDSHNQTVSGDLSLITISLTNADMEEDDLCVIDFEPEDEQTNVYFAQVE